MDHRFTTKDGAQHRVTWEKHVNHACWEACFGCGGILLLNIAVLQRGYESERTVTMHHCDGCFPEWGGV